MLAQIAALSERPCLLTSAPGLRSGSASLKHTAETYYKTSYNNKLRLSGYVLYNLYRFRSFL